MASKPSEVFVVHTLNSEFRDYHIYVQEIWQMYVGESLSVECRRVGL